MPSDLATVLSIVRDAAQRPADPGRLDQVDPRLFEAVAPVVDRWCRTWFDLTIDGTDHVPRGPALIVGNHNSGISFVEALGMGANAWVEGWGHMDEAPWHALAHDAIVDMPALGPFLIRAGAIRASHAMADAAFEAGRKILVFPGGNLEAFRSYTDRHRVTFGPHRGYARLALRHQVPIVPQVNHGGHRGLLVLRDNQDLARWSGAKRLLRTDTFPLFVGLPWGLALGPWFHLPPPVPCHTRFLAPIDTTAFGDAAAAHDPEAVEALHTAVITAMQGAMDRLVAEARPVTSVVRGWLGRR